MNPYKILSIDKHSTKRDIIQAAAFAMRERKHDIKEIAAAQKELIDTISGAAQEFLQFIDLKSLRDRLNLTRSETQTVPSLEYLSCFEKDS
jgi:membrane-bound ClpP family serine protease